MSIIPPTVFTLYQYINRLNGKRYIGVTNNPKGRKAKHARGDSGARAFNGAVKKYGVETFDYTVLAIFDDAGAAAYHERAFIHRFGTLAPFGYNLTDGASGYGYGGAYSNESKIRLSESHKGKIPLPQTIEKRRQAMMGHKVSSETREKIRIANIGKRNGVGHKF
jgi:group I intron endonuclease